jgi:chromosome segregation ATPase
MTTPTAEQIEAIRKDAESAVGISGGDKGFAKITPKQVLAILSALAAAERRAGEAEDAMVKAITEAEGWQTERNEARQKADAEMLRVKACEHIALGDEGWESLRNECPSTAAVAALRDALKEAEKEKARINGLYQCALAAINESRDIRWNAEAERDTLRARVERLEGELEGLRHFFESVRAAQDEAVRVELYGKILDRINAILPCETKGPEDLEPGCCRTCRARAALTKKEPSDG